MINIKIDLMSPVDDITEPDEVIYIFNKFLWLKNVNLIRKT